MIDRTGIVVFKGLFFFGENSFPIISSISAFKDGAMTKPDADFAKKVETDALTKALSKLGFNADVFMGMYDDHKYVQMMNEEFNKPQPDDIAMQWIEAVKADPSVIEQLDGEYKKYIQSLL